MALKSLDRAYLARSAAVFGAYLALAHLFAALARDVHDVSGVWPPTGVAVAAFITSGARIWPAVALGALAANLWEGHGLAASTIMTTGSTVFALLVARVLARSPHFDGRMRTTRSVVVFSLVVVALAPISATMGIAGLRVAGHLAGSSGWVAWKDWWVGDVLGAALFTPLVLAWRPPLPSGLKRRGPEALAAFALLAGIVALAFSGARGLEFVIFPAFVWIALRLGVPGVTAAGGLLAVAAAVLTAEGHGPFVLNGQRELWRAEGFVGCVAFTGLLLATAVSERRREERRAADNEAKHAALRDAHRAAGFATWEWRVDSDRPTWTDAVSDVIGFPVEGGSFEHVVQRHFHPDDRQRVMAALEQMAAGSAVSYEARVRPGPEGPDVWVHITGQPDVDDAGAITRVHGAVRAVDHTRVAEDSYWHTFADAPVGIAIVAADGPSGGEILQANRALGRILGYPADELVGLNLQDLTAPEDLEASREVLGTIGTDSREAASLKKRYLRRDGERVNVLTGISVVRDATGRPLHRIVTVQDLSETLRVEREARLANDRYRHLVEASHEGIWASDAEGITTFVNERVVEMLGGTKDDYIGKRGLDLVHPDDRERVAEQVAARNRGESGAYEIRVVRQDGGVIWVALNVVPQYDEDGQIAGGLAMITDVTNRHAIDALRAELASAVGGSADAIVTTSLDGYVRTWNPAAERIYGYSAEEVAGKLLDDLVTPADRRAEMAAIRERVAAGEDVVELDTVRRRKDGSEIYLSLTVTPLRDPEGKVIGLTRIARDMTEREIVRREIEESERRFRQIVETANEGVWVVDPEGRTRFVNARMAEIVGSTPFELQGRPFIEFLADPDAARERFASREERAERLETQMLHSDGRTLDVLVSTGPLHDQNGTYAGALAMVVDMTATRQAEREAADLQRRLHQMQRLETVGQLAGGIAHDFNNLLSVVLNYAEFALMSLDGHEARDDVAEIKHAAERAADLTQQLLLFSRQEVVQPEVLDLNALVESLRGLMVRTLGENVELRLELRAQATHVEAGRSQLEQVLMNFAVNARDAMPDGGHLTIGTSVVRDAAGHEWARLSVADSGHGMPESVKERIFEPFFTTKPPGSGTGLGLATVFGIVSGAGGRIEVETEPGNGTTFMVDLPLSGGVPADPSGELPVLDPCESQSVLVIEDEDAVRRVAMRLLEEAGYTVLAAADGEEALAIAGDPETRIDAVLTDVIMPGMQGYEVAECLREVRPGIPVVFMSGYTERMTRLPADAVFIEKPFRREQLTLRVREAIDAVTR